MPRRDPRVRLLHMCDYAQRAIEMMARRTREELDTNQMLQLAVARLVELVGEAASQVPVEFQRAHAEIPWPAIIGMRHRLIHGYDFVDMDILWDTVQYNLPELVDALERILGKLT